MHRYVHYMIVVAESYDSRPEQGALLEIERQCRCFIRQLNGFIQPFFIGDAGYIANRKLNGHLRRYHHHRLAGFGRKCRAKNLMPPDYFVYRSLHCFQVQRTEKPANGINVIGGIAGLHPVYNPDAFLIE